MSVDSIRAEIDLHRGATPEASWLVEKDIIDASSASSYEYELVSDWHIPGSESYIMDFRVNSLQRSERLIAKACIKMCASATVQEWVERRQAIEQANIAVPKLYSVMGPDILEEYIPQTLKQVYLESSDEKKEYLHHEFFATYRKLTELGFTPVSLHDVRSHGEDVVLVDFGSDLGGMRKIEEDTSNNGGVFDTKIKTDFQRIIR